LEQAVPSRGRKKKSASDCEVVFRTPAPDKSRAKSLRRELVGRKVSLTESYHLRRPSLETTRLSSKGQVVLPKSVRDAHQWRPGTEFIVENTADGVLLRPAKPFPPTRLEDVAGCLRYGAKPKTLRQMEAAIGIEVKARRGLGRF
jgi:AbrB family looped-hinge helix DNA binding protein